jgi:hypothetical protein
VLGSEPKVRPIRKVYCAEAPPTPMACDIFTTITGAESGKLPVALRSFLPDLAP